MTTPIEHAAEIIAQAQNVPFVGTKQRKIAEALAAAGLIATETEWGVLQSRIPGIHRGPMPQEQAHAWIAESEADGIRPGAFVLAARTVTPWSPA